MKQTEIDTLTKCLTDLGVTKIHNVSKTYNETQIRDTPLDVIIEFEYKDIKHMLGFLLNTVTMEMHTGREKLDKESWIRKQILRETEIIEELLYKNNDTADWGYTTDNLLYSQMQLSNTLMEKPQPSLGHFDNEVLKTFSNEVEICESTLMAYQKTLASI